MGWESYLDNTYWDVHQYYGEWAGDHWFLDRRYGSSLLLDSKGTWYNDPEFNPTKARVTCSSTASSGFYLRSHYDDGYTYYVKEYTYLSGNEITLLAIPGDIGSLELGFGVERPDIIITAIDFFFPAPQVPDPPFSGKDYSSRRLITVKKEAVSGDPKNVHVMAEFSGARIDDNLLYSFIKYQKGALLKLITPEEVEIPCEVGIKVDGNGQVSARLFFLAPELSSSKDTHFYLYYGNRNNNAPKFEPEDVWKASREGVWHYGFERIGAYATVRG